MTNRRVERHNIMSGTGMMTDPERLREIEEQQHHSELNARLPPKTSFRQVLNAPANPRPRKPDRPRSKEKLRPSAKHPSQQVVGFAEGKDEIDALLDAPSERVVLKV